MPDLAEHSIQADLNAPEFLTGVARGAWRVLSLDFPIVLLGIRGTEPDGSNKEWVFRYLVDDYPSVAPMVQIWDVASNCILAAGSRPTGNQLVAHAFKSWSDDTVYRPWERKAMEHGDWKTKYPNQVWNPTKTLANTVEDLNAILNGNARKAAVQAAQACG
jgi:hypothetical protein